jgi:hypothetical protein
LLAKGLEGRLSEVEATKSGGKLTIDRRRSSVTAPTEAEIPEAEIS